MTKTQQAACNAREFFEDDNKRLSMGRLLAFLSFIPASYVVLATTSTEALGWYVSAYVLGYVGGKGVDVLKQNAEAK